MFRGCGFGAYISVPTSVPIRPPMMFPMRVALFLWSPSGFLQGFPFVARRMRSQKCSYSFRRPITPLRVLDIRFRVGAVESWGLGFLSV